MTAAERNESVRARSDELLRDIITLADEAARLAIGSGHGIERALAHAHAHAHVHGHHHRPDEDETEDDDFM